MVFCCFNIYSPTNWSRKIELWEDVSKAYWDFDKIPSIMVRDFNSVRNSGERLNCQYSARDSRMFNYYIENLGLEEIDGQPGFTWYGSNQKRSVLDRALVNAKWLEMGNWVRTLLPRRNSDHKPILLFIEGREWGPKPFKFFYWWLKDETLTPLVVKCWRESSQPSFMLKIRELRMMIKNWNREKHGNLDIKIKHL